MFNALFISIHARFVREMAALPTGVEVIVCSGSDAAESRDYTDFTETEALMAAGRIEALDVLVRHGVIDAPVGVGDRAGGHGGASGRRGRNGGRRRPGRTDHTLTVGHPGPSTGWPGAAPVGRVPNLSRQGPSTARWSTSCPEEPGSGIPAGGPRRR